MKMSRTFSTVLFHTVTVWPELSRFLTMPLPMMPRPRNPKLNLLGWMSFSLNIWLLVTWRLPEVENMVAARQTIHTSCLNCFNFEVFLVWLTCCDIRAFVIVNIIIVVEVTSDL